MSELGSTAVPGGSLAPSARAGPRTSWPTIEDVRAELRLDYLSDDDEAVLQNGLDAAIAYVTARVRSGALVDDVGELLIADDIWQATVLYASRIYKRRDSLDGTIGWTDTGGVVAVRWRDADVENLLGHWLAVPL